VNAEFTNVKKAFGDATGGYSDVRFNAKDTTPASTRG
jgi:hypothetical protein